MCDEDSPSVCSICGKPLRTGQPVIQIVEDVHPSYDREIVTARTAAAGFIWPF
jgi:hypothetical protein